MTNFKMTAPAQSSNRRDDVKLLPAGPNPGILYSIVDCGTTYNSNFNKWERLVRLTFEFPLFKQLFRTDDTEERPTVVSVEYPYIVGEKSNLKKFIDGAVGRVLNHNEYKNGFDIGQFLGKAMVCTIIHKATKSDPNKVYERIQSVQGITEHVRQTYNFAWDLLVRENELMAFVIDQEGTCFQSEAFSKLPNFLRTKIMNSKEAKEYADKGGKFIEQASYEKSQTKPVFPEKAPQPTQRQPVVPEPKVDKKRTGIIEGTKELIMTCDFTYEQMEANNWTPKMLVENGYAKWEELPQTPGPIPKPNQNAPVAPVNNIGASEEDDDVPF